MRKCIPLIPQLNAMVTVWNFPHLKQIAYCWPQGIFNIILSHFNNHFIKQLYFFSFQLVNFMDLPAVVHYFFYSIYHTVKVSVKSVVLNGLMVYLMWPGVHMATISPVLLREMVHCKSGLVWMRLSMQKRMQIALRCLKSQ